MASCSEKDLDNQNSKLISESVTPVVRTSFIENVRNSKRQILATAIVTLGSFGTGTVFGWSAVANDSVERSSDFDNVSPEMISWMTSLAILGAFAGGPLAGFVMDFFGRKLGILIFSFPFLLGWITMCLASVFGSESFFLLYVGRLITGMCAGSYLVIIPTYIKETSTDEMRGVLGSAMPLMLVTGILYTFLIGTFFDWCTMSAFCGLTPLCLAVGTIFVPETPHYLMGKGEIKKAIKSFKWLSGIESDEVAQQKLLSVFPPDAAQDKQGYQKPRGGFLTRPVLTPVVIIVFVMFFQQFGGVNAITMYSIKIFQQAGTFIEPHTATIILGVEQIVFVLISMFLVDVLGRKTLLVSCNLIMAISLAALGAYFHLKEKGDGDEEAIGWLPFVTIYIYMAAYSCGVGSVPWVLAAEIYNPEYRAPSATIMTSSYWIFGFIVAKIYDNLNTELNVSGSWWFYGAFCFGGALFALAFVPETKGKSSEQIAKYFSRTSNSSLSANNNYSEDNDSHRPLNGTVAIDEKASSNTCEHV